MTYPLSFVTKKGSSFRFESSLVLRGRVSMTFLLEAMFILFEGFNEVYMYFSFLSLQ